MGASILASISNGEFTVVLRIPATVAGREAGEETCPLEDFTG